MTTISATMIEDSISTHGIRLRTFELRYPRCIHAELMTHRVFSRNAASSRAIPVKRLIEDVMVDPFVPLVWGKNQKGMQSEEELNAPVVIDTGSWITGVPCTTSGTREEMWLHGRDRAVELARAFDAAGYHKQIVNRLLEPWAHITVCLSSTDFNNWYALRNHKDAEPHIEILAQRMFEAEQKSIPTRLAPGEWHLPYIRSWDILNRTLEEQIKLSVARCASTSYRTVDGQSMTDERAIEIHDRLLAAAPVHASPAEHQATPDELIEHEGWLQGYQHGNFRGWRQYRKTLPNEAVFG